MRGGRDVGGRDARAGQAAVTCCEAPLTAGLQNSPASAIESKWVCQGCRLRKERAAPLARCANPQPQKDTTRTYSLLTIVAGMDSASSTMSAALAIGRFRAGTMSWQGVWWTCTCF